MYQDAFGLRNRPFGNTPDPAFFYVSIDHRQALFTVSQGIRDRCGLMLLLGEVGTGKTTVCHHIRDHDNYLSTYLNNPYVSEIEFLEEVNRGLRVPLGDGSKRFLIDELESHLLGRYYRGQPVVLIVDEAHRFGIPIFDQILTLSNLQVPEAHLLQVILVANPSILDTLRHPRLRSLNQRIGVRYHLGRMDYADTVEYVNFRLKRAGCTDRSIFTAKALEAIWKASGGTPRLINQLGERALSEAHTRGKKKVGRREVKRVVSDPLYQPLFVPKAKSWSVRTAFAGTVLALCAGVSLGLWYFGAGSKFLQEATTGVRHVPVESRTLIKKPITVPSLAAKGGMEPASTGTVAEEVTLPTLVSTEDTIVRPEFQTPQTTHTAAIFEPFGERLDGSTRMSTALDSPELRLSAIAWHEDPARCIAVVNDRIVHEGDFLGEVRVLRIEPDHIVLIYGNEHIIKGIHSREEEEPSSESNAVDLNSVEQSNEVSSSSNRNHAEQRFPLSDFSSTVNFDYNTSKLRSEAREELDRVVSLAKQSPNHGIAVFGYTDAVGSNEYNKWLSELRAGIVEGYLIEREIDPERITTVGMGEENPLATNTTREGRAANRRVEIRLVPAEDYSDSLAGG